MARTQARVYAGNDPGDEDSFGDDKVESCAGRGEDRNGDAVVRTEMRAGSFSSSPLVDGGGEEREGQKRWKL